MPTGHASRVPRGTVLVLSWALLTTRGLCNYWDNGKLTSGVNYGGKGYHHILVEELQGSGTYSGGSSEYWSGSGSRPGSNWHWSSSGKMFKVIEVKRLYLCISQRLSQLYISVSCCYCRNYIKLGW